MEFNEKQLIAIESDSPHKVIVAPAGSGKTSTIVGAILRYRKLHPDDHIVAITFTRKASAELKQRIGIEDNIEISTIHSWAWRELQRLADEYNFKVQLLEENAIKDILKQICKLKHQYYLNQFQLYSYVMGNYNVDVDENIKKTFEYIRTEYIKFKQKNKLYDFTDLPNYLYDKLTEYYQTIRTIDALFVDEFQDIDPVQYDLFTLVEAKEKCYIGDPAQCQPVGTKILLRGGIIKNIENVQVGDSIVYYDQKQGYACGLTGISHNAIHKHITAISHREYNNDFLITITSSEGKQSSYTSNHRTFIKLNNIGEKHIVYLMCDSNYRFRVGKIGLTKGSDGVNAWRKKMKDEGCEKIWILKIFNTDHEAKVEEAKISYTYGIPQICWQLNKVKWTKEEIDYIYQDINIYNNAKICLQNYNLDIRFPLLDNSIDWLAKNHFAENACAEIYAINIIPEYMSCLIYGSKTSHNNKHFDKIIKVNKEYITDPITVYSLETEGNTYVADSIITHNCIYQFRGSVEAVFEKLDGFDFYSLDINYRSYQEILDYASTLREEGLEQISYHGIIELCDIEELDRSPITCIRGKGGNVYKIPCIGECSNLTDDRPCSDILIVKTLFADKNTQVLCRANKQVKKLQALGIENVSTIHQAKGLEYDNVILVDFPCDNLEELNIAYVGATRAKNNLCIVNYEVLLYIICQENITSNRKLF